MATVREVVDEVSSKVHSFTAVRESLTSLTDPLDDVSVTFGVADTNRVISGLIEIDSELLYVDTADAGLVTLFPFGRGYDSTLPVTHDAGTKVLVDPLYPRTAILRAMRNAVDMCAPELFQPVWATFTRGDGPQGEFALPDAVTGVRSVQIVRPGWPSLDAGAWDYRKRSDGSYLRCLDMGYGGAQLEALCSGELGTPSTEDDDLDDLGWGEVRDPIVWATCWQLLQSQEPGRLDLASVAQATQAEGVPIGSASKVAQQFYASFGQRKTDTLRVLNRKYPIQMHKRV